MNAPPSDYTSWTAKTKVAWLHDQMLASAYEPCNRPPLAMLPPKKWLAAIRAVRRKGLLVSLNRNEDVMAPGRPKVIHTQGAAAVVECAIDPDSPYSGLLAAATVTPGVMRMSLAAPPGNRRPFVPGFGLKLLIDHQPAADLLAVHHTNGQGLDSNLFSNSMTHDLTHTHSYLRPGQWIMGKLFYRVSRFPRRLSIDHFGAQHGDGTAVPSSEQRVPARLEFVPAAAARGCFRGRANCDYRDVLAEIEPGTMLFDVVAHDDGGPSTIGTISLSEPFVASAFGDNLFFRHVQADRDLQPRYRS